MAVYTIVLTNPDPWPAAMCHEIGSRVGSYAQLWKVAAWDEPAVELWATDNVCIKALLHNWETGGQAAVDRLLGIVERTGWR